MNSTPKLGRVQLQIMQVLWARGRATAREITDELNRSSLDGGRAIAHSTVQTLLRKLEGKGAVTHQVQDRVFVFEPLHEQSEVTNRAVSDLLTRLFDRSVSGLVAHLVRQEEISPEELERLRHIVAQAEASQSASSEAAPRAQTPREEAR
jgi:BlaI family penicillinase repressor